MLKGTRVTVETDISYTGQSVGEPGQVYVVQTQGSGVAIGDAGGAAFLASNPSGYAVAGLLMNYIVNIDLTRYHLNFNRNETQVGNRVTFLRKGTVTTNQYVGSPTDGAVAYLTSSGLLDPTAHATGGLVAKPKVGTFRSLPDESNFVRVDIMLPS